MVFSSLKFIFIFIPIFFTVYCLSPAKFRNAVLLIGSLSFYFIGTVNNPEHFILFIISIVMDFVIGILIERYRRHKKLFLIIGITFHLLSLATFKYLNFVTHELSRLIPNFDFSSNIVLPIGISFYTFQGLSYIADVYKEKICAEQSLMKFAVYISMFEQLIAGPIVTFDNVQNKLSNRRLNKSLILNGIGTFVFGLGLKVLLANPLGKLWSQTCAIGLESISTLLAWIAIAAFSFQIYFDFFGYSLMALGLGKMLGFDLPQNFNHPYTSLTMTEFWRRWHITLGSWFREYIYIPLGGNRKGMASTLKNLFIVWILTGIWHGAGYNFILWGTAMFIIIAAEKLFIGKFINRIPIVGRIYMMLLIPLTWAIFEIEDMRLLGVFFTRLFPITGQGVWSIFRYDYIKYLKLYYPFLILGILFSSKLPYTILKQIKNRAVICALIFLIFGASVWCLMRGLDDPFLYFRF